MCTRLYSLKLGETVPTDICMPSAAWCWGQSTATQQSTMDQTHQQTSQGVTNNHRAVCKMMGITSRKRIIGARRACEQTSVFQLLGEIRERKHQHTMIHAHHHDQSVSTQVIVVLNFKI